MVIKRAKCLLVAAFSLFLLLFSNISVAQDGGETSHEEMVHEEGIQEEGEKKFDANKVIFGHVMDAHEFHFFSYECRDGQEHHATLPLPVILYSPQKGFSTFMS